MRRFRRSVQRSTALALRHFSRKQLAPTAGAGLIFLASAAFAQPADKDDIPLPPVDVRASRRSEYRVTEPSLFKMPDPIKDIPQTINVLPLELMRQQGVFSLRDSLRNVSGVTINAAEGGVQGDNLTIRGFNGRNDIYLDGVRDWGSYTRDTFNLEAVEVLKGPSSAMFGRGSTGGLVNQVSKTPLRVPLYDFQATVGTPEFWRATMDVNQPFGTSGAVRLNAMFQDSDVAGRDDVHIRRWGAAPSVSMGLGGPTQLTLSFFHQQEDNVPDNGLPFLFGEPAPVSRDNFYGIPDKDFQATNVNLATLRVDHALTENIKLRNQLRYGVYLFEQEATAPRIVGAPTPQTSLSAIAVSRGAVARDRDDRILADQTDLVTTFDTWMLKHTLITGSEIAWETTDTTNLAVTGIPNTDLLEPSHEILGANIRRTRSTRTKTEALTLSLYAIDEVALTEQWKVIGGLRWDRFHVDFDSRNFTTLARTVLDRTDSVVSPRGALLYLPTSTQTYYFAYGTSFNPSGEALTLTANTADTPPEKTQLFELGAKWQLLRNALSLNAALFRIDKTDARTAEPGSTEQTLDGRQRSQGFEIEAVGRLLPGWSVLAAYTYLHTDVLQSNDVVSGIPVKGKQLIAAPEHSATLWTTYDITPAWQIGGGATYVGRRAANNVNTNFVPGYVKADATVAYRVTRNIELRMNVLNISDSRYFEQVYQGHTVPGAGRSFLFSGLFSF
jgi:catecholate siderophore receptor